MERRTTLPHSICMYLPSELLNTDAVVTPFDAFTVQFPAYQTYITLLYSGLILRVVIFTIFLIPTQLRVLKFADLIS
jgi:hypothetical protein